MEESVTTFSGALDAAFGLEEKDWRQYSPLTLAYIGDAVYDLIIRTIFVKGANCQPQKIHQKVTALVNAKAQSRMIRALLPALTREEASVFRRGRNSKPYSKAKHATMGEYLDATGLEALVGYLYLKKEFVRMDELIREGIRVLQEERKKEPEREHSREENGEEQG